MIVHPHPDPDKHQKLLTSRGSALAHAYFLLLIDVDQTPTEQTDGRTDGRTNGQV